MNLLPTAVLALVATLTGATAGEVRRLDGHDLAPIILMQGHDIVTCGVSAKFGESPDAFQLELTLRVGASSRRLDVRLRGPGEIKRFDLTISNGGADPFAGGSMAFEDGLAKRDVDATGEAATPFLRDFFVAGQDVTVGLADGRAFDLVIAGPVPNSVRAAYLGCAGDLRR